MDQERIRIRELVREVIESGRSVEDVCGEHPDLLIEVRRLWQRARAVEDRLEALFPSSDARTRSAAAAAPPDHTLPQIPGYDIQGIVGRGGMGVVYKARHLSLNRTVAIKVPLAGAFATASERQRHTREAQAVAALGHPNIITVHDVGEFDGQPYFTMEFIDGQHLGVRLANTPQPAREAAALVATLADATDCAHQAGIIHRDLKPANVLLAPDGAPKIADFGLARQSGGEATMTVAGFQFGTPSYMSPEQASGQPAAQSSSVDIYSLGAILYEMLTGRPPFRAENAVETLRQVLEEEPAPPSRLNPKVPRDLETVCLTCLRKEPQRRYSSAQALAEDLRRFLKGEPIRARAVSPMERLYKSVRRRPAQAAAWCGAAAALAAVAGTGLWTASQRASMDRGVSEDLVEVVRLEEASDWTAARNMLERAKTRLGASAGSHRLSKRISEAARDLDLVDRLAAMRLDRAASREVGEDAHLLNANAWRRYRELFSEAGLLREGDAPEAFAARVADSPARSALIDAMDDWAINATDRTELEWLLSATRLADPDPRWRDRARDATTWYDQEALAALAREADVEHQSVTLLLTVAGLLHRAGAGEAEPLLRRIQAAHPSDFSANFAVGENLGARADAQAIVFFRAAIALRPEAAVTYVNLGNALADHGHDAEAIDQMRRATALDPGSFTAQYNLAIVLLKEQRPDEAVEPARIAATLAPAQQLSHRLYGRALARSGRYCEAVECFRRALELVPDDEKVREYMTIATSRCEAAGEETSPRP